MRKGVVPIICTLVVVLVIAVAVTSFAFLENKSSKFTLDVSTENNYVIELGDITNPNGVFNALASKGDNSGTWATQFEDKDDYTVVTITVPCLLSVDPLVGYQSTVRVSGISIVNANNESQTDLIGYMRNAFEYKVEPNSDCFNTSTNEYFVTGSEWASLGQGGAVINDNAIPRDEQGKSEPFSVTLSMRINLPDDLVPYAMIEKGLRTIVHISVGLEPIPPEV